jgi:acetoacetate decarboxylase
MGFVKTPQELSLAFGENGVGSCNRFYRGEVYSILYETKPEIIERVLPPGLKPYEKPYVIFHFRDFKHINFAIPYQEPALIIPAVNKGRLGSYAIAMTLSTDIAAFSGRERAGYPKKCGIIKKNRKGNLFTGSCERHGIQYATMRVDLNGITNEPYFKEEMKQLSMPPDPNHPIHGNHTINYNYQAPYGAWGSLINSDKKAQLTVNWKETVKLEETIYGTGSIDYLWSDYDPWAELEVVKIIGAQLTVSESALVDLEVAEEIPIQEYLPYMYNKWDVYAPYQERNWDYKKHDGEIL